MEDVGKHSRGVTGMKNRNSFRFRSIALVMAAIMIMGLLAACGQSNPSNSGKPDGSTTNNGSTGTDGKGDGGNEKVEIRYSWWGSQGRHDRTLQAIE
ncbi:hypothetical protein, partial [Halorubrum sp. Atlit-9R]|uniref:hypothetical protein n=1 Tax=Halorubrum sp. Atlit-9R TaxID=2282127 RepID=UPI0018F60805